ncbi:MAG: RluA family pseudouridine synthase [Lachnospiraceae bacterium]|nr:RluA family pseudouridine synthase [Lachnospiraceae bacterium]
MPRILEYQVKNEDAGRRVRDILHQEFRLVAHDIAASKYRVENGITVNGVQVMVNRVLLPGEVLRVILFDEPRGTTIPAEGPLDIRYEDEDLIVLNKPAGCVVHPSHGHYADSLANFVAWHYQETGQVHELRTVGRLDKDTSGLIVFGKSRTACSHLTEQASEGVRKKRYLALAEGVFPEMSGDVEAPIAREIEDQIRRVVREDGDYALTHFRVERQFAKFALLSLEIETGRTHQIRVHMAHIGHPLLGDPLYGSGAFDACIGRAALHAEYLEFLQPFSNEKICLTAELPADMQAVLAAAECR